MESTPLKAWELENAAQLVDPHRDALYSHDAAAQKAAQDAAPWREDPHHFKHVRVSALAMLKMVTHARSGGALEVMGILQGTLAGDAFVVTDAFRLPVEGTETRVNAGDEANAYLVEYLAACRANGRAEDAVGWYHSHPGYGCWLSGIDVATQQTQQLLGAMVAVVVDPDRTVAAGKVEIGAFRTYPDGYTPPSANNNATGADEATGGMIPLAKSADFGAHADRYYALEVSQYKSTLDAHLLELLWNKYWVATLGQNPLATNRDYGSRQMLDLAQKTRIAERSVKGGGSGGSGSGGGGGGNGGGGSGSARGRGGAGGKGAGDEAMEKVVRAGNKIAGEEERGLLAGEIKARLFHGTAPDEPEESAMKVET